MLKVKGGRRTRVIAEIGNNHEGDIGVARELVQAAAAAGVDAVKFQTFIPENYTTVLDRDRQARLRGFQLSFDQFAELAELTRGLDLGFISTPLDLDSARFLGGIVDAIKIASGDNTFYPLIACAAESGKPMIISTGIADEAEIAKAVACARAVWARTGAGGDLTLLHCVVSYPAAPDQANLAAVGTLRARFPDETIGYSDHTIGAEAACLAVALGAEVLEKHFTLDNNYSDFRDHQVSADPDAMRAFVDAVRRTEAMLGAGPLGTMPCEEENITPVRRSLCAARDLPAGAVLGPDDVNWVRPGGGIPPGGEAAALGKKLTRALAQGEMVQARDLQPAD